MKNTASSTSIRELLNAMTVNADKKGIIIKETEAAADDNIGRKELEENSDKALVTIIHCNDDIEDICEEKAIEKGAAGSRVMTTPEVDRSVPYSSTTLIPEEKSGNHDNNALETIERDPLKLGIVATSAVGVKQCGIDTENSPKEKIAESTSSSNITIISEAEIEHNSDDTEGMLAIIEGNFPDSDIMITLDMQDKHHHDNTGNTPD